MESKTDAQGIVLKSSVKPFVIRVDHLISETNLDLMCEVSKEFFKQRREPGYEAWAKKYVSDYDSERYWPKMFTTHDVYACVCPDCRRIQRHSLMLQTITNDFFEPQRQRDIMRNCGEPMQLIKSEQKDEIKE